MKPKSNKKPIRVFFLNGDSHLLVFDSKTYVQDLLDQVCASRSIKETQFFGLSLTVENESFFLDEKEKLAKYAPKNSVKSSWKKDGSANQKPASVLTVTLEVQFFVEHPKLINDADSRHYYYLHLKKNLVRSAMLARDETVFTLAATALHIDFGTFDKSLHTSDYFKPGDYLPEWFIRKWGEPYLKVHLPEMHGELSSWTIHHAHGDFIEKASTMEDISVHNYKLFKTKTEKHPSVMLGISGKGIRLQHLAPPSDSRHQILDLEFSWNKIGRFLFAAKRFEIYPDGLPSNRKLIYYTGSRTKSKCLLKLLRKTHSLHLSLTSFVLHLKTSNGILAKRNYRECYIDGSGTTKKIDGAQKLEENCDKPLVESFKVNQRSNPLQKSITSHRSSQTSGIESDERQQCEISNAHNTSDSGVVTNEASSSDGVICITDEHLQAPPSKNLSVTNLLDAILKEIGNPDKSDNEKQNSPSKKPSLIEPKSKNKDCDLFSSDYFLSHTLNYSKEPIPMKPRPQTAENKKLKSKQNFGKTSRSMRRTSSGISDILDLLPDVPGLESDKIESNSFIPSYSSRIQGAGALSNVTENTGYVEFNKTLTAKGLVDDSKSKHLRSNSIGADSLFDFNPSEMLTTLQQDQSVQDDPQVDQTYCNFDDLDYFSDANLKTFSYVADQKATPVLKHANEIPVSQGNKPRASNSDNHKSSDIDFDDFTSTRENCPCTDTSSANILSRSEKQKNIPFTFHKIKDVARDDVKDDVSEAKTRKEKKHTSMLVSHKEMKSFMRNQAGSEWDCSPRDAALHRRKSQEMYSKHYSKFLLRNNTADNNCAVATKARINLREKQTEKDRIRTRPLSHDVTSRSNADKKRRKHKAKRPFSAPRRSMNIDATEILV